MAHRILIFSLAYYPSHVSGAEIAIKETTDRIDSTDIQFFMVTHRFDRSASREEQIGNVRVYRVGFGASYLSKMLFVPLAAWKAASLHRKNLFDASWVMMTYMLFPLVLAKVFGMRGPYILTLQDGDSYEKVFERWFIKPVAPILNWGFRHARMIQAISHSLALWPARRGYRGKVQIIPNGASIESAEQFPVDELTTLKAQLGKKEGDIFILSISRLVHQKAIDVVIHALTRLPEQVQYVVVGDGTDREDLQALAHSLHVASRVHFVGHVDRRVTALYRNVCDIFVFPSRSEGQGISLMSSMLAGIPIIATQVGGIADFLFDAKRNPDKPTTGWAVDVDTSEQIAAAVQNILANPDQVQVVTETAKRLVLEHYNWDTIAHDLRQKVFETVLSQGIVNI